ncbi:MAG: S8 family serine peptidase [Candidatus Accumulibacter sp.]|uniref:S8 family serine peptidase n=1 Tax=Accumulibacter sp. TaxID=2053492 RepID=UPI001A4A058C|nr:S8 family serine peptidase [Accumulibacter sp.]MBL8394876.1 S8 family serine peptidase [Accumulibacter sp.]
MTTPTPVSPAAERTPSSTGQPLADYNDPALAGYWHLWSAAGATKGANVASVWSDYRGSGVVVAVIDDGIDYTHPDLTANYAPALDRDTRDHDDDAYPSDPTDRHGTTVAGVIAAALDNAIGGSGVAPAATLAGFRIGFGNNGTLGQILEAYERLVTVDVANNSWGFGGFFSDSFLDPELGGIAAALQTALASGRNGLGTVVVFAAGNGRSSGQDVNYHAFQNQRGIISVAATDWTGNYAYFSTPGAALLVAAPGQDISTTDRVGALGYSGDSYATMSGTSFSSPLVSGVAALMLDANDGLGWRDVQEILAATAVQTGGSAGWSFNGANNWNGGGMHASHDYGFGLVDAFAAVRVAESWRNTSTSDNEWVAGGVQYPGAAIPDVGSISSSITLPDGLRIDHVEVEVLLTHGAIAQLQITLTAPDGTQSLLVHNPPTSQANLHFNLSTTHDWGELSGGTWTLTITDPQSGAWGTFNAWALRAYGDLAGDDTYVYTDEFGSLASADPARLVLADQDGNDTLNSAAVGSDSVLDLRPGQLSSIDGQTVIIASGTLIENADSGDGNDRLIGNDAANSLRGWRGNDTLDGGAGNDTLDGGSGDDTFLIDASGDLIIEAAAGGNDTVVTTLSKYVLGASLENLSHAGTAAFSGTGNAAANSISGGAGRDTLSGGLAADTLQGGAGDDTYYVDNALDILVEAPGEGSDTVYSSIDWVLGANIERLYLTGAALYGNGNDLANTLYGTASSTGNLLRGGAGNDTYYAGAGDSVAENANEGTDSVYCYGDFTLAANVEHLYLNVTVAASLNGNSLANSLRGNAGNDVLGGLEGNDTLNGGSGADTLYGGAGNDTYYVDNVLDSIVEGSGDGSDTVYASIDWVLGANTERLYLTGSAINGSGNDLANTLYGTASSTGNLLRGGPGNDVYYAGAGDSVEENENGGSDAVYCYGDFTLAANVEHLYLNATVAASLNGNNLANSLRGNAGNDLLWGFEGNDTLNGGSGGDTLYGGAGDDTYYVDDALDGVVELLPGDGRDTVNSSIDWALGANLERLSLTGSAAIAGSGNDLANTLYGNSNSAANLLSGGQGNDTYYAGVGDTIIEALNAGSDSVYCYGDFTLQPNVENLYLNVTSAATLAGNELANSLRGNAGNDLLSGLEGNDTLNGGLGADTLNGGVGNDLLSGAGGADRFVFDRSTGSDKVIDFTRGEDLIQLSSAPGLAGFADLDTNHDGIVQTGDDWVRMAGADLVLDIGGSQLQIVGQTQLLGTDFLFV